MKTIIRTPYGYWKWYRELQRIEFIYKGHRRHTFSVNLTEKDNTENGAFQHAIAFDYAVAVSPSVKRNIRALTYNKSTGSVS